MEKPLPDDIEFTMDPVVVPIDGELDLHTFSPKDLDGLLEDYIEACREKNIYELRIVHGKGSGVLRSRVRSLLKKNTWVLHFNEASAEAGGWGATLVTLRKDRR